MIPETCDLSWETRKVPCPEDEPVHEGETAGDIVDAVHNALGTVKREKISSMAVVAEQYGI